MAALAGLGLTDIELELTAPELPALDGSSLVALEWLQSLGSEPCGSLEVEGPFTRIFRQDGLAKVAVAKGEGHWRYTFDSGERFPFHQVAECDNISAEFASEIAPARTFGWESELEMIRQAGLAKGLDESSAVLLSDSGPINPQRFENEPARHKLLDAVGDLYLAGAPIHLLSVSAERSGHKLHVEIAKQLCDAVKIHRL